LRTRRVDVVVADEYLHRILRCDKSAEEGGALSTAGDRGLGLPSREGSKPTYRRILAGMRHPNVDLFVRGSSKQTRWDVAAVPCRGHGSRAKPTGLARPWHSRVDFQHGRNDRAEALSRDPDLPRNGRKLPKNGCCEPPSRPSSSSCASIRGDGTGARARRQARLSAERKHPHAHASYRVVRRPDRTFAVEVTIPDTHPTTVSSFPSAVEAEAWIAAHKGRVAGSLALSSARWAKKR